MFKSDVVGRSEMIKRFNLRNVCGCRTRSRSALNGRARSGGVLSKIVFAVHLVCVPRHSGTFLAHRDRDPHAIRAISERCGAFRTIASVAVSSLDLQKNAPKRIQWCTVCTAHTHSVLHALNRNGSGNQLNAQKISMATS